MNVITARVARSRPPHDLVRAEQAAAAFMEALGLDLSDEHFRDTPGRVTRVYSEMLTPRDFRMTTFDNDEKYDELVLVRSIPVRSVCEHHLLPFTGVAHVGYLPAARILGLPKPARVVEMFAHGVQVEERLIKQIADWLTEHLRPNGVGVVIEAEHLGITLRGVQAVGATTVTSTMLGVLRDDARSRAEFLAVARADRC